MYFKGSIQGCVCLWVSQVAVSYPTRHGSITQSVQVFATCVGLTQEQVPPVESYSHYHILFLNFILYYFCTFKILSGNILKIFFVSRCRDSLLSAVGAFIYGNCEKRLLSVCLMIELQTETWNSQGSRRDQVCSAVLQVFTPLNLESQV